MRKDKKLKLGDNIMVCGTLDTYITKIENDKIYFLNEDKIEQFETIDAIEFLGSSEENTNKI